MSLTTHRAVGFIGGFIFSVRCLNVYDQDIISSILLAHKNRIFLHLLYDIISHGAFENPKLDCIFSNMDLNCSEAICNIKLIKVI